MDNIKDKLRIEYEEYRLPYTKYENGVLWVDDSVLPYYSWVEKKYIDSVESAMCKANSNSVLTKVRAFINDNFCFYDEKDIKKENCFEAGYNSALRDVLTRLYKYFD